VEGGRKAAYASNGDEKEGAWGRAFKYADQHSCPSVNVLELRAVKGGRRAIYTSDGDEKEGA